MVLATSELVVHTARHLRPEKQTQMRSQDLGVPLLLACDHMTGRMNTLWPGHRIPWLMIGICPDQHASQWGRAGASPDRALRKSNSGDFTIAKLSRAAYWNV